MAQTHYCLTNHSTIGSRSNSDGCQYKIIAMTTCYKWDFTVSIIRKSGRKHNNHGVIALGCNYSTAHFDMMLTLKKRRTKLVSVVRVRVMEVAFALDDNAQLIRRTLADGLPEIPENLNL